MQKSILLALSLLIVLLGAGFLIHFVGSRNAIADATAQPTTVPTKKQLWTCGMHPQVVQDHPGTCPICHMKLTPMRIADGTATTPGGMPEVVIDPAVVQNMGIQTAEVTRGPIVKSIQTVGVLEAPETGLHDISPKVSGWIEKLYANQDGMHVHKDDPLFDLYSPDLVVAEQELIGAVKSLRALGPAPDDSLKKSSEALVESARNKLRLLDVSEADINAVADKLLATKTVTFRSPVSGAVIDKTVVEGSAIQAGQKLMRIEDHSSLWLELQVYEDQMSFIAVGEDVQASVEAFPGKTFTGRITFIHPHIDHMNRTVTARAVLDNPELSLHPGMYASAAIMTRPLMDAIQVPRESVIDTGTRQITFVAKSAGHFDPRIVHMSVVGDNGRVQILDGLSPGETVVTSGEFLLDVESRTTEAIQKLRSSSTPVDTEIAPAAPMPMAMPMPVTAPTSMPTQPTTVHVASPVSSTTPAATAHATTAPAVSALQESLAVAWCPMKKAHWLQIGSEISNPYFGTQMPDCGEVQRRLAMPDAASQLTLLINAYLRVQTGLAADRFEKGDADVLKMAAQQLSDPAVAKVRSAALALASATDIPAARIALISMSETLLQAITESAQSTSASTTAPSNSGVQP